MIRLVIIPAVFCLALFPLAATGAQFATDTFPTAAGDLAITLTPEMVADAASAFKPKVLYPYHYGNTDTAKLVALLKDAKEIDVRVRNLK